MARRFDSIQSGKFAVETWDRKTYGTLRGKVIKPVSRNSDGTFRPSTNRSPEVLASRVIVTPPVTFRP